MSNKFDYITHYQAMGFYFEIEKIRINNPTFIDEIIDAFEDQMAQVLSKPTKFPKTLKIYKIPTVVLNQLLMVTKFNIYDKELISFVKQEYKKRKIEQKSIQSSPKSL